MIGAFAVLILALYLLNSGSSNSRRTTSGPVSVPGGGMLRKWINPRGLFALLFWPGTLILTIWVVARIVPEKISVPLGAITWAIYMQWATRFFLVNLRPKYGVTLTNQITGDVLELNEPGLHPVYPWHRAEPEHFFSFEEFTTETRSEDFPSKDSKMSVKYSARLRRIPGQLYKQLGVNQSVMMKSILDKLSSELHDEIRKHKSENLNGEPEGHNNNSGTPEAPERLVDLEDLLMQLTREIPKLAGKYGLEIEPVISDMDFDKETQKARTLRRVMNLVGDSAADLKSKVNLTNPEIALESTLVVGNFITKTIEERGVRQGTPDKQILTVINELGQAFRGDKDSHDKDNSKKKGSK